MSAPRPRRAKRHAAFLDSSAFYALADPHDANNTAAKRIAQQLHAERWQLVTTNFIRAEAHALLLNRLGHAVADSFLRGLRESPTTTLIRVTEADEARALDLIARYQDKGFRPRQMILYTGLQSGWPKATLTTPDARERAHRSGEGRRAVPQAPAQRAD